MANIETAQTESSLLALAISSLLVPAAFDASLGITAANSNHSVLPISRGTSVILLVVYGMYLLFLYNETDARYLYFQLKSHAYLYDEIAAEETEVVLEHATITPWWAAGLYEPFLLLRRSYNIGSSYLPSLSPFVQNSLLTVLMEWSQEVAYP